MKINQVVVNNRKQAIIIETRKGQFELPFSRLDLRPKPHNRITQIGIDRELGGAAVTYQLESGDEASVHLDVFLDYNRDPDYLRMLFLYELTVAAQKALKKNHISKNEICRRLKTSPSQLARLIDQTNRKKSVDKMLELLAVLGVNVRPHFENAVA